MCIFSIDGTLKKVNPALSDLLGIPEHKICTKQMFEFIHPDDHLRTALFIQNFLSKKKTSWALENRFISCNGKFKSLLWKTLFLNGNNELCGIAHDVTNLKHAAHESEDLRNKFFRIIDLVPHPVFLKDEAGKYILVNEAQARFFSKSKMELLGKTDDEIIATKKELELIHATDRAVIEKKKTVKIVEQFITDPSGTRRILHTTKVPFHNSVNGEINILGVSIDLTELKDTERELKRINFELDTFVYRASHDLKAPLCSITGLLNLMLIEKAPELKTKCIEEAKNRIKTLTNFINDLTDYSRNNRLSLKKDKINFKSLIEECFEDLQYLDEMGNITKKISIQPGLTFYTDKDRIKVLLMNVISNSIKYYDRKKAQPQIVIEVLKKEKLVCIKVWDNGIGIEACHHDKIFDMFYRASEHSVGSGLGLYIVKQIGEKLNGTISMNSEMGKFTEFTVTLEEISD